MNTKFSKWIKTDLHIHTDYSNKTKSNDYKSSFSVDVLLGKVREHGLNMISLTDHNIINCGAYEDIMSKCSDVKILVGVELDVALSNNALVEYVKRVAANHGEKINDKPFHVLVIFRSPDFRSISDKLEKMFNYISKNLLDGTADLSKNQMLRVTTLDAIVKHFNDEDFFLIAHGNKDKGIVESCKDAESIEEAQYEILMGSISALEMKSTVKTEAIIKRWNYDFERLLASDFRMRSPTTYVVFSDNHNCHSYCPGTYQTWMKGDASFETLRLAFSDPESRVHTSERPPSHVSDYIEGIDIKLKNTDKVQSIHFSPYLNVIIGGRSSGKSLLFNTLVGLNTQFGSTEKRLFEGTYASLIETDYTKVKQLTNRRSEKRYSIAGHAFCQESIIDLFDDVESLGETLKHEFPVIDEASVRKAEEHVDELFTELQDAYEDYFEVAGQVTKNSINEQIEIALRESHKLFSVDISELRISDNVEDYSRLKKTLADSIDVLRELDTLQLKGSPLFSIDELEQIKQVTSVVAKRLTDIEVHEKREEMQCLFARKVERIIYAYVEQELSQEKRLIEDTKRQLEKDLRVYQQFFKTKLQLRRACEALEKINLSIRDHVKQKSKYTFVTKVNLDVSYDRLILEFFSDKILNYDIGATLFRNMVALASNDRPDVRLKQFTSDGKTPKRLRHKLDEFVRTIKSKKTYEIIENRPDGTMVSTLSTSQGRQASIFLDITLSNLLEDSNSKLLLIDQPEDNMDNRYISQDIVELLRKLKNRVQVILVTHNPSIAIYGDAENIIIAENDGGVIGYRQGGLENEKIREDACLILDGGEVAFKNRMDKYNIEMLLREDD
jgi:hypothetical protein